MTYSHHLDRLVELAPEPVSRVRRSYCYAPRLSRAARPLVLRQDNLPSRSSSPTTVVGCFEARSLAPTLGQERCCTLVIEDDQFGRPSPQIAPVVANNRAAETHCRGEQAGARVGRSGCGVTRAMDATA